MARSTFRKLQWAGEDGGVPFKLHAEVSYDRYSELDQAAIGQYCEKFAERLSRLFARFDPDLIHLHLLWVLASLAERFAAVPWVVTLHGTELKQLALAPQHGHLPKRALPHIRRFFCVSKDIARDAVSAMGTPAAKTLVIGNGFNPRLFSPIAGLARDSPPVVLCAGKFVNWKGFVYAIHASARVRLSHRLVILGTGPQTDRDVLKKEVERLGLGERVIFPGHVPQACVADWMRRARVFLLPSIDEPFGLVLLEAMACGCPVVAAASGGPRDLISRQLQDLGLATLVPPLLQGNLQCAQDRYVLDLATAVEDRLRKACDERQRERRATTISRIGGRRSRSDLSRRSRHRNGARRFVSPGASGACGNGDFGNIPYAMMSTMRHIDYVHWNPMKHGLVERVADWPYSSFHRFVRPGLLSSDWAGGISEGKSKYGERQWES